MEAVGCGDSGSFVWPAKDDVIETIAEKVIDVLPVPEPMSNRHIGWKQPILESIEAKCSFQ